MDASKSAKDEEVMMRNCCERESSSGGMFLREAAAESLRATAADKAQNATARLRDGVRLSQHP